MIKSKVLEKREKIVSGELSPVENVEQFLKKIEQLDKKINAFIDVYPEFALQQAQQIEQKIEKGQHVGRLAGLVVAVKSNINVKGLRVTCASKTLENYIAPYDATVIEKIRQEDGIIIGMTNMDEFACGSSGETSYFGPTDNPRAPGRIPGGSSSGSAAAVAANFCDLALGSDTGGSIRNPASHCGVVGFKPSYGLVSRYGLIDLAMSLDQIGPLGHDVASVALLLDVIKGKDYRDMRTEELGKSVFDGLDNLEPEKCKLAYIKEIEDYIVDEPIKQVIEAAISRIQSLGFEVEEISMNRDIFELALPTYYLNVAVEFFSATRRFDGRRYGYRIDEVAGPEVKRRIIMGRIISAKEYQHKYYRLAQKALKWMKKEFNKYLAGYDALLMPVVPKLPHRIGEPLEDPRAMYAYDIFTIPVNIAGACGGVVPAGTVNGGIPVGLQIIGKPFTDDVVLRVMYAVAGANYY
ncbi:MAG: Asp-tRNA(Asn)/Glu-tRNA(Gln) amidotransferase subunit GatA [bacterium]|nr:Asp-tRNA(Asn)/Glu-tRNA(Gln) amidotransferase subunit GatA [bacterium]